MRIAAFRRPSRLLRAASSISSIPEIAAGSKPKNRFRSLADTGDLTTFRKIPWSIDPSVTGLSHEPSTGVSLFYRSVGKLFSGLPRRITPRDVYPDNSNHGATHACPNKIFCTGIDCSIGVFQRLQSALVARYTAEHRFARAIVTISFSSFCFTVFRAWKACLFHS